MPTLNRLRIQQSFRDAKPLIGQKILRRACTLRNEFKIFLNNLNNELMDQLAMNIFRLLTDCVVNIDFPFKIASTSSAFGKIFAQLCIFGFRPDLFSVIADSMVTECVRNGGAHKRCETLIAWSQLMQFIFSNVRDGYYSEIRQQRRSSLPQQQLFLKQKHNLNTITTRGSL
ncbi:hypothetical protein Mgra_00009818 [Meloidogyne graminicola]|uniref:GLOBIN domain-containing protein n=1 Tax=Meloidogyne graminicola TaxID=189291 RepID=A0A8S9ZAQ9_9BILA|nr:hypothetical protein Mgra_00009818 [Meloidogyne graminicola]